MCLEFFFCIFKKKKFYRMWKYIFYVILIFTHIQKLIVIFKSFISVNIFDIAFYSV